MKAFLNAQDGKGYVETKHMQFLCEIKTMGQGNSIKIQMTLTVFSSIKQRWLAPKNYLVNRQSADVLLGILPVLIVFVHYGN